MHSLLLILALLFNSISENGIYELSPYVGTTIDREENAFYSLFEKEDFETAYILKIEENTFYLFIKREKGKPILRKMEVEEIEALGLKIEEKGEMPEEERNIVIDPNKTRLFIMPTGETLKKGERYFADYELFLVWFSQGLTDRVMLSAGFTLFPTTPDNWLFYLGPKVKLYDSGEGNFFSLGSHIIAVPDGGYNGNQGYEIYGSGYMSFTTEKKTSAVTLGGGVIALPDVMPGFFGGLCTGKGRVKFLAEYWHVFPEYGGSIPCLIVGFRFTGKNLSSDLGLFYPHIAEYVEMSPVGFPIINFVYNF